MSDMINHPLHYTNNSSGVECIEVTEHMSFCTGNAFKYVFRHRDKNKPVEDLNKAVWYLNREISNLESQNLCESKINYIKIGNKLDLITEVEENIFVKNILLHIYYGSVDSFLIALDFLKKEIRILEK